MDKKPLYSIGHGSRKIEDFLFLLQRYGIDYLIDVRSQPYSKFHSQYSQNALKCFLEENNVRYVFMGDTLGGRPKDTSCYNKEGKIDYGAMSTKDFFLQGISRLRIAYEKNVNAAIMCSERNPCHCHRSKLIGRVLDSDGIVLMHIDEHGDLKDQTRVINERDNGLAKIDLFGCPINVTSVKGYSFNN